MDDTILDDLDGSTDDAAGQGKQPVVLAVDDEERVIRAFKLWLGDAYEVRMATDGEEAFEKLDADVDVVLLDRRMPGLDGEQVLERIRDQGFECRVAMVTGVDPDFDIVDMPFDDYVQKPVDRSKLRDLVERLLSLSTYDDQIQEYFSTVKTQAVLDAEKTAEELADSEAYSELATQRETLQQRVDQMIVEMDPDQIDALFRQLGEADGDDVDVPDLDDEAGADVPAGGDATAE